MVKKSIVTTAVASMKSRKMRRDFGVENSAYPHTDFIFTMQLTPPDPLANPFELLSDRPHVMDQNQIRPAAV